MDKKEYREKIISEKHKNIRLLDKKYYHVRITKQKIKYHKLFPFSELGSKYKALCGAIQYRDQLKILLRFAKENGLVIKDW